MQDGSCIEEMFNSAETGPLANVLACEGRPGKVYALQNVKQDTQFHLVIFDLSREQVLEIRAKCRTGEENFVTCMRQALIRRYGEKSVAMGGVFQIVKGKAKLHIMVYMQAS